eukprot:Sspe_Gene.103761::Locus_79608_Transcript_1_1_Confidence_1.000_Length_715::g.103761::m.103761
MRALDVLGWLLQWAYREGEPVEERFRKTILIPVFVFVILMNLQALAGLTNLSYVILNVVHAAIMAVPLLIIYTTKRLSLRFTEILIIVNGSLSLHLRDFLSYGELDIWTAVILQMDLLLLCDCRQGAIKAALFTAVIYISYITLEQQFPTGIFDVLPNVSTVPQPPEECHLPSSAVASVLFVRLACFLLDFTMTRRFASTMHAEQARM